MWFIIWVGPIFFTIEGRNRQQVMMFIEDGDMLPDDQSQCVWYTYEIPSCE
jgi:hypothetical protein